MSRWAILSTLFMLFAGRASGQELTVVGTSPGINGLAISVSGAIDVDFDRAVDRTTVTDEAFWAFGRWSGAHPGVFSYSNGDQRLTLTPTTAFSHGEQVTVYMANSLMAADGSPMRPGGYSFQFWTATIPSSAEFEEIGTYTTRTTPSETTRSYGGVGCDFNNDGYLDVGIVNEDTSDFRVFLNLADGSALLTEFLEPPAAIGSQGSPNESGDFNRDGNIDVCVSNAVSGSISVLIGNGDGTFAPQQWIEVGATPRGIVVLDVDGDGDQDLVNANQGSDNMSLLVNDGNGTFANPIYFGSGISGEWPLATADFDEDGILDLVVGSRDSGELAVLRTNGDGTFTSIHYQQGVGAQWMFACGDLDGDGHADITSANSWDNSGVLLFGDGAGNLGSPISYPTVAFALATDVGDLDGDGDLDWIVSDFGDDWHYFENNGSGVFTLTESFPAPQAGSCALLLDLDNDGDLDLALIDELQDVVVLERQIGPDLPSFTRGECNGDGTLNIADGIFALGVLFSGESPGTCIDACDANDDGSINIADPISTLGYVFGIAPLLPEPFPGCGPDASVDALDCATFSSCP